MLAPTSPPTPAQIRAFCQCHAFTQSALAETLGVSYRTVKAWLSETNPPPAYLTRALNDIARELETIKAQMSAQENK